MTTNLIRTEDLEAGQAFRFISEEGEQDDTVYVLDDWKWESLALQPVVLRYHVQGDPLSHGRSSHDPAELVELV